MANPLPKNTFLKDIDWYKDAIIYQVHVKSFFDANNDGVGDFSGLIDKLDYIVDLGVNAIWLLPFYPSPMRDDGYDIAEYREVDSSYGTLKDVKKFITEAHKRGLRVITELVINHTSDQHHWFQKARHAKKNSSARNFYVWSDDDQKYQGTRIIFSDTESANWTWDSVAGQYYWHRFYSHQPDLNFDNPAVLKEVLSIMRYWFEIGVDGLRLDAIPYLIEREGTANENLPETHDIIKKIRKELDTHFPDRMLLAEANLWPEDILQYFGKGDECHMAFHFPLMPRMYMAIAQEDRFPIVDILRQMPDIPECCQWALFLRNHDELTLEMVTDQERDYLWNHYAADERARINLGIRRRLAPLVERDRRRIELLNSLLLSLPGTPTLYYGDEIGMGDNIFLGDRHGVRTPMQWTDDRNGGFSRADPASLAAPVIMDPLYGFQVLNVEAQARDAHSLLNWTRRILAIRKQQKAFGRGSLKILAPDNRHVLAYLRHYSNSEGKQELILCVTNLSRSAQATQLNLAAFEGRLPIELIGGTAFPVIGNADYQISLPPYGFYWFLLADDIEMPDWYRPTPAPLPELITLIIKSGLSDLIHDEESRRLLQETVLVNYFKQATWLEIDAEQIESVRVVEVIPVFNKSEQLVIAVIEVQSHQSYHRYFLPLGFIDEPSATVLSRRLALSLVRHKRAISLLTDALSVSIFVKEIIESFINPQDVNESFVEFITHESQSTIKEIDTTNIEITDVSPLNGSVVVNDKIRLKPIRKIVEGLHPEIEMTRFLESHDFCNIVPLLGEVRLKLSDGKIYSALLLQKLVIHQGNAWHWTQAILQKIFREQQSSATCSMDEEFPAVSELYNFSALLGKRLGEMHQLLSKSDSSGRFGTHKSTKKYLDIFTSNVLEKIDFLFELSSPIKEINDFFGKKSSLIAKIKRLIKSSVNSPLIRVHGDLSLSQVLVASDDAHFINFGINHSSLHPEQGLFHSPLQDVSDVICSFSDAIEAAVESLQTMDVAADVGRLNDLAEIHQTRVKENFIEAYFNEINSSFLDREKSSDLIRLFSILKRIDDIKIASDTNKITHVHWLRLLEMLKQ